MFWEVSLPVFILVTVVLGGGAAYMTGRAMARGWQPWPRLIVYLFLLCIAVRFIHFSLFGGTFLIPFSNIPTAGPYFVADFVVLLIIGALGRQITRSEQMSTQYSFLYKRQGMMAWQRRNTSEEPE